MSSDHGPMGSILESLQVWIMADNMAMVGMLHFSHSHKTML